MVEKLLTLVTPSSRCGIPSPILAAFMCKSKYFWGRRGTMIIGALVTMAFFFAYTQVSSNAGNLGYTCAINFCLVSHSISFSRVLDIATYTHCKLVFADSQHYWATYRRIKGDSAHVRVASLSRILDWMPNAHNH